MKKRFRRGTSTTAPADVTSRSCSVHVLDNEEELRLAVQRAAEFDRRAADAVLARSAHYRALLSDAPAGASADPGPLAASQ